MTAGRRPASRTRSIIRNATSPDEVPSSTGMPRSRSHAASSGATALARFDSTQNGLVVASKTSAATCR